MSAFDLSKATAYAELICMLDHREFRAANYGPDQTRERDFNRKEIAALKLVLADLGFHYPEEMRVAEEWAFERIEKKRRRRG